jgi:hypothetical protein
MHPTQIKTLECIMKRLSYVGVIIIPLIVSVLFTGCPPPSEPYYITATIDGVGYAFFHGFTNIEPKPIGFFKQPPGDYGTPIFAQKDAGDTLTPSQTYASFEILSFLTAPSSYNIGNMTLARIGLNGSIWNFTAIDLAITKYGPVGGTIEGVFGGTIWDGLTTKTVSNGKFIVKRIADNSW